MAVSFLQTAVSTSDLTTYTFSSQNLGTASADRYIVALIYGGVATTGRTYSSVTIGGVSATISVQASNTGSSRVSAIAIANVPTGTTGDVVVTYSGSVLRCGIGLYLLTEIVSATAIDTGSNVSDTDETLSTTIDIPANGYAFAIMGEQTATNTTQTHSWTGVTESFDTLIETTTVSNQFSGSFLNPSTVQTGLTVSCTVTGVSEGGSLCVASYEALAPTFVPIISFIT